jgi:peroxiredoxin
MNPRARKPGIGAEKPMTKIAAGARAPEFSVKGLDGKEYSLGKLLESGPVVAMFFKVSCPVCQFTAPYIERLHQRYGGNGVTVLGIGQDAAPETSDFARKYGATFLLATDAKGYPASNACGLTNVPTIFLIDTDGIVRISAVGFSKQDMEAIATFLAERKKIPPAPLFAASENVPAYRPG